MHTYRDVIGMEESGFSQELMARAEETIASGLLRQQSSLTLDAGDHPWQVSRHRKAGPGNSCKELPFLARPRKPAMQPMYIVGHQEYPAQAEMGQGIHMADPTHSVFVTGITQYDLHSQHVSDLLSTFSVHDFSKKIQKP